MEQVLGNEDALPELSASCKRSTCRNLVFVDNWGGGGVWLGPFTSGLYDNKKKKLRAVSDVREPRVADFMPLYQRVSGLGCCPRYETG